MRLHIHQIVLEEVLQLPLGGRISEVPDIKSPALSSAGKDRLVLGGGGLSASGLAVVEGGSGHLGGNTVDWCGHFCCSFGD